jgi:TRAP-type transport system periplasmic protein
MRGGRVLIAGLALGLWCVVAAGALTIKLGSLAPAGSPWELGLKRMAAEWERLSAGAVSVRIYSGGVAGDEPDMVRKIRIGTLNAALVTVSGLQGIFNGVKTLSYPLLVKNDEELKAVLTAMKPYFTQNLEARGFEPVAWSPGGWVYFFSRYKVITPDDLRKQKLWVWSGDPDEIQAFQSAGFQTVTVAATDLMTSLQSGMLDALATSPLVAAANQWFAVAGNLSTLRLGPLWGAAIVSTRAWAEVPADLRPKLIEAAQRIFDGLETELLHQDQSAIDVMKRYGLKINPVTPAATKEWQTLLDRTFSGLVGKLYDRDTFVMVKKFLDEYEAAHPQP